MSDRSSRTFTLAEHPVSAASDARTPPLEPSARRVSDLPVVHIEVRPASLREMFTEAWRGRRLLLLFAWRDITLRYKQTTVGVAWVLLQPLLMMVVFSAFFSGNMPADGLPYPLFVYAGLTLWQLFAKVLSQTTVTLKEHESIISRAYFPRLLLFCSTIAVALVDFAVSLSVVAPMMLFYRVVPTGRIALVPVFAAVAVLTAMSVGIWLAMLDVVYRDVRQTLPVVLQAWMFCSPIFYSSSLVREGWRRVYGLNPLVEAVNGLRWSLLPGAAAPDLANAAASMIVVVALLAGGLIFFCRRDGTLVDEL